MMFVYPAFLWALAAVSVPIIIHLFNFRRYKKIYFTNVRFLKELEIESKSKSRLKELLILLSRILAFSALVLAFAQPVWQDKQTAGTQVGAATISLYIDNSFSMEAVNRKGPLLENAKIMARELVQGFGNNDRFHLITNDFKGKHQRLFSKEDMLREIAEIKLSPVPRQFSDVFKRQTEFINEEKNLRLFAISDLQKSTFNLNEFSSDSTHALSIWPLKSGETHNVFIDSVWLETPIPQKDVLQKLHVKLTNSSAKSIETGNARLYLNGSQSAIGSYSVDAESSTSFVIPFTCKNNGLYYASVKIDDYPISFDDEFFFAFTTRLHINTVLINGKDTDTEKYFISLFEKDSLFRFTSLSENAIDYSKLKNADFIILNEIQNPTSGLEEELLNFCKKGGSIAIIPPANANVAVVNPFLNKFSLPVILSVDTNTTKLEKPNKENPFFEGVFEKIDPQINVPVMSKRYLFSKPMQSSTSYIYSIQNGEPFLIKQTYDQTQLFLFTSSFNAKFSNFCKHALFVPTFIRIAINSIKPRPLFYILNNQTAISLKPEYNAAEKPPLIKAKSDGAELIPELKIRDGQLNLLPGEAIHEAGFYDVLWMNEIKQNLAFNYNRKESFMNFYTTDELNQIIQKNNLKKFRVSEENQSNNIKKTIQLGGGGIKLWKWFIILSLLFVIAEICLIRFLK